MSRLLPAQERQEEMHFWRIAEESMEGLASTGSVAGQPWPAEEHCRRRSLPDGTHLRELASSRPARRGDRDVGDDALRALSEHPLHGFWLQLLLLEALDRELGEETVLLAPPTHAVVDDVEGSTRVFYRPRPDSRFHDRALLELGQLDEVLIRAAAALGVRSAGAIGHAEGPWSLGLSMLAQVGIVQTRHDRWTMSTHVLDRLHGGGLMSSVIRRGKAFRERLHGVLEGIWRERREATGEVHGD